MSFPYSPARCWSTGYCGCARNDKTPVLCVAKQKRGCFLKSKNMHVLFCFFPPATWWPHPLRSTRSRPPCFAATSGDWQKSRTGKTTSKTARKRIQPIVRGAGARRPTRRRLLANSPKTARERTQPVVRSACFIHRGRSSAQCPCEGPICFFGSTRSRPK